ncbi:hypothetical protein K8T06_09880 [bacterium]|nr:hypothetical protein [bacterium]
MSCLENQTCCAGEWKVSNIITFLALANTVHTCSANWNGHNPNQTRKVLIKTYAFLGACKVTAISGEAYSFLEEGGNGILSCQNVFSDWKNGEYQVTFWMKDDGAA